ncbi:MAG: DNA internalization-related competence protein ComEC/Rec2 [Clostridium sp.]|nr:DNA internalization-related competence protein ComEC/Rec2 [Clostridium sp.]
MCLFQIFLILLLTLYSFIFSSRFPIEYENAADRQVELAGIVAGKVLKQSKTGVRTYLMVKTEKWQFSGGQSETLPAKGYVLCAVESGMGKTVAGQTERNISGRQGTSSQDGLPSIGSRVRISGSFSLYTEATNIGQFDARNYYAARKIYGQVKKAAIVYTEPPNIIGRGKECLWQLRRHLAETFLEVYGEENGALLAAMLLGERTFLSEETQSLYKAAGTLHVIAVSGLHISLLGLGLYRLLRRIFDAQAPAAVISVLCMAAYVFLVGNPPSAVRAFIMFSMGLLAGYWKRTLDTPTALSLSAAIILMGNPFYIGQSSFLLSFLAILAIAVFQPALKECLALINPYHFPLSRLLDSRRAWRLRHLDPQKVTGGCHELLKKAGNGLQSSFSVWIVTLPVQLFFFSEVSLFGIFFNLLIIPLMGVILLLGIAGLFLKEIFHLFTFLTGSALTDWEITVISICRYAEGIFFAIIKAGGSLADRLSFAMWTPGKPAYGKMLLAFGLLLLFCLLGNLSENGRTFPEKFWKYRLGILLGVILLLAGYPAHNLQITFLDVGQGDGICMELPDGSVYLMDGGSSDVSKVGNYRLVPFLKAKGIRKIDAVFLSHGDADHINGIAELLEEKQMSIDCICLPAGAEQEEFVEIRDLARARNISVRTIQAGDFWENNGAKFWCLNPADVTASGNAASMVLYMEYQDFSMLLTGDLEGEGEKSVAALLRSNAITGISVLKVAHHGSKNSTKEEFLRQCSPAVAVISCGEHNTYGHPHKETLERLNDMGTAVYRTDCSGAVQITVSGSRMKVTEYRRR